MKILHVIRSLSPEYGGPIEGVRRLAENASKQGYTVEAVSLDPPDAPFLQTLGFRYYALGPALGKYGFSPRIGPWMREHAHNYDGIVINGLWQYHGYATWRTIRRRHPYVVFTHGMLDPYFKHRYPIKHIKKWFYWAMAEYWMLRDARAVIFTSPIERDLAPQSFWLHHWRPVVVAYGTTGPSGDSHKMREAFYGVCPQARGKRLLLYLGRLHDKKGCDLLVRAFAQVAPQDPELYLMMAGPDSMNWSSKLQAEARTLGISKRVFWPGMLSGDAKWGAFFASEVFVLPSHQENFGIAVAEALACRVPVLITNKVNIWPDIAQDQCGLVEEDTLKGTCNLLESWIHMSAEDRQIMSDRALSTFHARYNMLETARGILRQFSERPPV